MVLNLPSNFYDFPLTCSIKNDGSWLYVLDAVPNLITDLQPADRLRHDRSALDFPLKGTPFLRWCLYMLGMPNRHDRYKLIWACQWNPSVEFYPNKGYFTEQAGLFWSTTYWGSVESVDDIP